MTINKTESWEHITMKEAVMLAMKEGKTRPYRGFSLVLRNGDRLAHRPDGQIFLVKTKISADYH